MIRTSKYTNLTASITGRGKRGLFALGEVAQKKLYTPEHIPSATREPGPFFTLLPLPHAAVGIPPSLPGIAHSATVCASHHYPTGDFQTSLRRATSATSARSLPRPIRSQSQNLLKPYRKVKYGLKDKQSTRESGHNEAP